MDWDKVFSTGWHTDSAGNKKYWGTADLDKIVRLFNPAFHEPPLVIGHPSDNAPAFGWVAGIKRVGEDLFLQYKEVAAEFKEWRQKGLYKKKSIAVYPDGSLRHVGYLGGMPPAIKGLPDYAFADGERQAVTYEFSDWRMSTLGRVIMKIRDYLVEKEGAEKADNIIGSWEVQDLLTPPADPGVPEPTCYHEENDMTKEEVQAMIAGALKGQADQFTEQLKIINEGLNKGLKTLGEQFSELQSGQAAERLAGQKREFAEFLTSPEMAKRIPEGQREATIAHLVTLTTAAPVEFGEGDAKKTLPAVAVYQAQLQALPPVVEFSEVATKDRETVQPKKSATRSEFDAWDAQKKSEFSCAGGTLVD